ncbi:MAG: CHAT domain-containing protein [Cyanobacteriota bacterium]
MQAMPRKPSRCGFATGFLAVALALGCGLDQDSARAQVSAGGLRTRVNGSGLGSCSAGVCQVQGGIQAGPNRFQRFSSFDTRPAAIRGVQIETGGSRNLVVGVSAPGGTFLNKPVQLLQPANLFWLSPGGIWLGQGGSIHQAPNLLLSTSSSLNLGRRSYNAITASPQEAAGFFAAPAVDFAGLRTASGSLNALGLEGRGPVTLAGGLLTVEQALAVDAGLGGVRSQAGAARTRLEAGETIRLRGQELELTGVDLRAGNDRQRGLIHAQTEGSLKLAASTAEGAELLLWGRQIQLKDSQLFAPRGLIRLESTDPAGAGTTLSLLRSQLDVGVRSAADLRSPAGFGQIVDGVVIYEENPTPTIALFARGDLKVAGSQLLASQDIDNLRRSGLPPETQVELGDTSGNVVLRASGLLEVQQSRLKADATDNLAGNIGLIGERGLRLSHAFLSASEGAGSGDLRLWSNGGIEIESSTLIASSGNRAETPNPLGRGNSWFTGGGITMSNNSSTVPITIKDSQLLTPYGTQGHVLADAALDLFDFFDDNDGGNMLGGGTISLFSKGGIRIGEGSSLMASGLAKDAEEAFGGSIQLINEGAAPLVVEANSLISASGGSLQPDWQNPENPWALSPAREGLIQLWSAGDLILENSRLIVSSDLPFPPAETTGSRIATVAAGNLELRGADLTTWAYRTPSPEESATPGYVQLLAGQNITAIDSSLELTGNTLAPTTILSGAGEPNLEGLTISSATETAAAPPVIGQDPEIDLRIAEFRQPQDLDLPYDFSAESASSFLQEWSRNTGLTPEINLVITPDGTQLILESDIGNRRRTESLSADPAPPLNTGEGLSTSLLLPEPQRPADPGLLPPVEALSREATLETLQLGEEKAARDAIETLALQGAGSPRTLTVPELQARLKAATLLQPTPRRETIPNPNPYRPAVVRLNLAQARETDEAQIDLIYIPPEGEPRGWRRQVKRQQLKALIQSVQGQISRMEPLDDGDAAQLQSLLLGPLLPQLATDRITALVIAADRGLQAIPFSALPFMRGQEGSRVAITMTPALSLTSWERPAEGSGSSRLLLAGATTFPNGLAPLPMVGQELSSLASIYPADVLLNESFTATALQERTRQGRYKQIHIASHAEFASGGSAVIHTGGKPITIKELGAALQTTTGRTPDLVSLSACRTTLGDERSELGLVGIALSSGSHSGIGTLWYVDDTANAAFFAQFYRYLKAGHSKDIALSRTQDDFRLGLIQVKGEKVVNGEGDVLLQGLNRGNQLRFANGFRHPYYWAGAVLSGSPW